MSLDVYNVEDEIYRGRHFLCIGNFDEHQLWAKQTFDHVVPRHLIHAAGYCTCIGRDGKHVFIMWMPVFEITPHHISVMTHELAHAAVRKLCSIGDNYTINKTNDEHFTYYLGYLVKQFLEQIMNKEKP